MIALFASLALTHAVSAQAPAAADTEAPIIEDVAAASSSPASSPVISVTISDRGTGVGTAAVVYRVHGSQEWQRASLQGTTRGLFIARLPDGVQTSGFDYYVEATDLAGNGPARIGAPEKPIRVAKATKETATNVADVKFREPPPAIHPAWLMVSLGAGVLAGAGAGAYALDIVSTNERAEAVNAELEKPGLSDERRADLQEVQRGLNSALVGDVVLTTVLGVVAVAGLGTGITLAVLSSME